MALNGHSEYELTPRRREESENFVKVPIPSHSDRHFRLLEKRIKCNQIQVTREYWRKVA